MLRFLTAKGFRRALAAEDTGHAASKRIPVTFHAPRSVSTCNHTRILSCWQFAFGCIWLGKHHVYGSGVTLQWSGATCMQLRCGPQIQ